MWVQFTSCVQGVVSTLFSLLAITMLHSARYNLKFCRIQLENWGKDFVWMLFFFFHLTSGIIHLVRTQNFLKTNISNPLIRTRTYVYQGVRNVSFFENFAYVINDPSHQCYASLTLQISLGILQHWHETTVLQGAIIYTTKT